MNSFADWVQSLLAILLQHFLLLLDRYHQPHWWMKLPCFFISSLCVLLVWRLQIMQFWNCAGVLCNLESTSKFIVSQIRILGIATACSKLQSPEGGASSESNRGLGWHNEEVKFSQHMVAAVTAITSFISLLLNRNVLLCHVLCATVTITLTVKLLYPLFPDVGVWTL